MAELDKASQLEQIFPLTARTLSPRERTKLMLASAARDAIPGPEGLPELLEKWKWPSMRSYIPDLARLELLLFKTRSAQSLPLRGFEEVTKATEPDWYLARFRFDPALSILESEWPLDEIVAQPFSATNPAPGLFLVYRQGGEPAVRRLSENEAQLIRSLTLGVPLGKVLERKNGPDFDAFTFQRWMETGILRAIDWAAV